MTQTQALTPEQLATLRQFSRDDGGFRCNASGARSLAQALSAALARLEDLEQRCTQAQNLIESQLESLEAKGYIEDNGVNAMRYEWCYSLEELDEILRNLK